MRADQNLKYPVRNQLVKRQQIFVRLEDFVAADARGHRRPGFQSVRRLFNHGVLRSLRPPFPKGVMKRSIEVGKAH